MQLAPPHARCAPPGASILTTQLMPVFLFSLLACDKMNKEADKLELDAWPTYNSFPPWRGRVANVQVISNTSMRKLQVDP